MAPPCISLPFLHGPLLAGESGSKLGAPALWPGLPGCNAQSHWQPDNFPFEPDAAARLLHEFSLPGPDGLETMRLAMLLADNAGAPGRAEEMAVLASFAESGEATDDQGQIRLRALMEQAQKALLWLWLQEQRLLDLAALECRCESVSSLLANDFGESDAVDAPVRAAPATPDLSLLPSWRVCLASAALFLPVETMILAHGEMARDLWEILEFSRAPQWEENIYMACAPLWQVAGSRPYAGQNPFLGAAHNAERRWLVEKI